MRGHSAVARPDEIPGIGVTAAQANIAEIGLDMSRFLTPAHLASWAKFAPGSANQPDARKAAPGTATATSPACWARPPSGFRTGTFLGGRYRQIARRSDKKRATVAVGRSILIIVWHLLSDEPTRYQDLGSGHYDSKNNPQRRVRNHVRELQALGYTITLSPAA